MIRTLNARWSAVGKLGARTAPLGRSSHTVNLINGKVYVFSGEHAPRQPIDNTIHIFDLNTGSWVDPIVPGAFTPSPRVGHASASIGKDIYYFGGRGGLDMAPLEANVYIFNTETSSWSTVAPDTLTPQARSYHAMTSAGNKLYVFGGCPEKGRMNDLHSFNSATRTWEDLYAPGAPPARGGPGLAAFGESLYVYGGFDGVNERGDVFKYDLKEKKWTDVTPEATEGSPIPRSVFGFVAVEELGGILALCGEKDPSPTGHIGSGKYLDDSYLLLIKGVEKPVWVPIETADRENGPTPRGWIAAAAEGKEVVVHGGFDGAIRDDGLFVLQF
ncbi:hypothetical protein BJ742DRAFT_710693 [Cladochytrium replicatum]|nr:hypothetical protein BJ742DRAFT_710693 [Cladochytrium replicatum]